ncbi:hypothetical protein LINPERHAP1_LOCUS24419, partial [Linum perenne]
RVSALNHFLLLNSVIGLQFDHISTTVTTRVTSQEGLPC